jgi:hypothetical protein
MASPCSVIESPMSLMYRYSGWWFGTMEFYDFPYIGNFIIPTDFHMFFQRGRYTTNQDKSGDVTPQKWNDNPIEITMYNNCDNY